MGFSTRYRRALNSRTFRRGLPIALALMPVTAIMALDALGLATFNPFASDAAAKPAAAAPKEASDELAGAAVPAATVPEQVFARLGAEYEATGKPIISAGLPHPATCIDRTAMLSTSQAFEAAGVQTQVTVAVYGPGFGALAFDQVAKSADCAPTGTNVSVTGRGHDLAAESMQVAAAWSTNRTSSRVVRSGDVLVFVTSHTGDIAKTKQLAKDAAVALNQSLAGQCADTESVKADARRNPMHSKFEGLQVKQEVTAEEAAYPELPIEDEAAGVERIQLPVAEVDIPSVVAPTVPDYPVWPQLPEVVEEPNQPADPEPQLLRATWLQKLQDVDGPGCGWAFTGTTAPAWDQAAADAANDAAFAAAQAKLDADAQRWSADVLAFWRDYSTFRTELADYSTYRKQVAEVTDAWDDIAEQWADYRDDLKKWEKAEKARTDFIVEQTAAAEAYQELLTACLNWKAAGEDPADPVAEQCPAERPEILDEDAPEALEKPTEPADPRPANKR